MQAGAGLGQLGIQYGQLGQADVAQLMDLAQASGQMGQGLGSLAQAGGQLGGNLASWAYSKRAWGNCNSNLTLAMSRRLRPWVRVIRHYSRPLWTLSVKATCNCIKCLISSIRFERHL